MDVITIKISESVLQDILNKVKCLNDQDFLWYTDPKGDKVCFSIDREIRSLDSNTSRAAFGIYPAEAVDRI